MMPVILMFLAGLNALLSAFGASTWSTAAIYWFLVMCYWWGKIEV